MDPRTARSFAALTLAVGVLVLASSCGSDSSAGAGDDTGATSTIVSTTAATSVSTTASTTTEPARPEPTTDIMATAAHQLLTVDNTFGGGELPFSTFLVRDHTDTSGGSPAAPPTGTARPLTSAERSAVEQRLAPLGEVRWIGPTDHPDLDRTPAGIVGVGEPTVDGDTAQIGVSLECGSLCGTWLTYSLTRTTAGDWTVTGIVGPIAVS